MIMESRNFFCLVGALTIIVGGCNREPPVKPEILLQAVEDGDQAAHADMFADSALMLPNHWTHTQGKELIAQMITGSEGWVFKLKDVKHLDMGVSGDLGYTINDYYYTWYAEGDEPEWHKTKNIHIWKRQPDGTWKLHADIWNSSEPLPQTETEE